MTRGRLVVFHRTCVVQRPELLCGSFRAVKHRGWGGNSRSDSIQKRLLVVAPRPADRSQSKHPLALGARRPETPRVAPETNCRPDEGCRLSASNPSALAWALFVQTNA